MQVSESSDAHSTDLWNCLVAMHDSICLNRKGSYQLASHGQPQETGNADDRVMGAAFCPSPLASNHIPLFQLLSAFKGLDPSRKTEP